MQLFIYFYAKKKKEKKELINKFKKRNLEFKNLLPISWSITFRWHITLVCFVIDRLIDEWDYYVLVQINAFFNGQSYLCTIIIVIYRRASVELDRIFILSFLRFNLRHNSFVYFLSISSWGWYNIHSAKDLYVTTERIYENKAE